MNNHTPGPWAAYQKQGTAGQPLPQWRIHGPGICGAIATVDFDLTQPTCAAQNANVAANAAYIVRACNAHEELIAALKQAKLRIIQLAGTVNTLSEAQGLDRKVHAEDFYEAIDNAIAKAEEGRA